jgi:hypothetical protein
MSDSEDKAEYVKSFNDQTSDDAESKKPSFIERYLRGARAALGMYPGEMSSSLETPHADSVKGADMGNGKNSIYNKR